MRWQCYNCLSWLQGAHRLHVMEQVLYCRCGLHCHHLIDNVTKATDYDLLVYINLYIQISLRLGLDCYCTCSKLWYCMACYC